MRLQAGGSGQLGLWFPPHRTAPQGTPDSGPQSTAVESQLSWAVLQVFRLLTHLLNSAPASRKQP